MGINRIKVAFAEIRIKNKWLAEKLEKYESTIFQRFTNSRQPSLENLLNIANTLNVDIKELVYTTTQSA